MPRPYLIVVSAVVSSSTAGTVLWSQPNDRPSEPSFFSDAVPGQFFSQRMADNFSLTTESTVDIIRWWGGSQNFLFADLTNMESWTVRLYEAGAGGGVGDEVFAQTYQNADNRNGIMTITPTGETNFTGGAVFEHAAETGGLSLAAGDYWISVGATLGDPNADGWVWAGSTVGDLVNATDGFSGSGYTVFDPTFNDLAFEIEGAVIPAPGVGVLFGLTLVARRRR